MTTTADDVAKLLRDLRHHRNEIGHYTGFEFVHALRDTLEALQAEVAAANKDRDNALAISQMTHRQWREAEAEIQRLVDRALTAEAELEIVRLTQQETKP